jgi:hypothetical protein
MALEEGLLKHLNKILIEDDDLLRKLDKSSFNFDNVDELRKAGFEGFKTIRELFLDNSELPQFKGVYLVLYLKNEIPEFLKIGTGGYFKGKNPNILIEEAEKNWVGNTIVVYIGKAGGENIKATLKSRLRQYFKFGQGKNIGHMGGRLIWQLKDSGNLVVCWKTLPDEDPVKYESDLIKSFKYKFNNRRPFANLKD